MPGRSSQSRSLQIIGALVAVVAVVGTVALGWEWGEADDVVPIAIGAGAAVLAVGWTIYTRLA